nr:ribonuclease H-like domain-containing protein [Tanacetum cinerariifolium]
MPTSNTQSVLAAHTGARIICAVRNGKKCSTTALSSTANDVNELPLSSECHSHYADIIRRHGMRDVTYVLIFTIFERFRNMSIIGLKSNYVTHPGLPHCMFPKVHYHWSKDTSCRRNKKTPKVAMISTRLKKFYKKTGRKLHFDAKEPIVFDKRKVGCFNYHNTRHFARECRLKGNQDSRRRDAGNATGHAEDDTEDYALMAFNSSNSGSDTEVTSCSKVCEESYAKHKKLYGEQKEQLGDASIEIQAYTLALKKVEAQLVYHQKNQLAYEEKISQMSAKDKSGPGYGSHIHDGVLSYENEVIASVFDSRSSDVEDCPVNDRFAKVKGMHAVPPPITGNYVPPKFNLGIDESNFTYCLKQSTSSESNAKTSDLDSYESSSSEETLKILPKPIEYKPKVVNDPKV